MSFFPLERVKDWGDESLALCQSYLPDTVEFLGVSAGAYAEVGYNGEHQRFIHVTMTSGGIRPEGQALVSFKTKTAAWDAYKGQIEAYLDGKTAVIWRRPPCLQDTYPEYGPGEEQPPSNGFTVYSRLSAV